jgi:ATP-dependent RNA circularization protein (DNA/RNA ligase family)
MEYLQKTFTFEKMARLFPLKEDGGYQNVMLFGEGYGPKIQACGSKYRSDHSFILFDVVINEWWLKKEDVKGIAQSLEIDTVPDLGVMTEEEVVNYVKSMPLSKISKEPLEIEGVVCRSEPLMFFRNGKPIMWKLKCKDMKQREEHDRNNSNAN